MSESDIEAVRATQLKAGNHIVKDGDIYLIRETEKSKAGKHGHAKCRIKIENIFTGSRTEITVPGDTKLQSPIIDKRTAQVLNITSDSVQLMDMESYETFETILPTEEEIREDLKKGEPPVYVEYWRVIGKRRIMRIKP